MPSINPLALLSLFSCRPQIRPLVGTGAQPRPPRCQGVPARRCGGACANCAGWAGTGGTATGGSTGGNACGIGTAFSNAAVNACKAHTLPLSLAMPVNYDNTTANAVNTNAKRPKINENTTAICGRWSNYETNYLITYLPNKLTS